MGVLMASLEILVCAAIIDLNREHTSGGEKIEEETVAYTYLRQKYLRYFVQQLQFPLKRISITNIFLGSIVYNFSFEWLFQSGTLCYSVLSISSVSFRSEHSWASKQQS